MSPVYEITARRIDRVTYRVEADSPRDAADAIARDEARESINYENVDIDVLEVRDEDGKEVTP